MRSFREERRGTGRRGRRRPVVNEDDCAVVADVADAAPYRLVHRPECLQCVPVVACVVRARVCGRVTVSGGDTCQPSQVATQASCAGHDSRQAEEVGERKQKKRVSGGGTAQQPPRQAALAVVGLLELDLPPHGGCVSSTESCQGAGRGGPYAEQRQRSREARRKDEEVRARALAHAAALAAPRRLPPAYLRVHRVGEGNPDHQHPPRVVVGEIQPFGYLRAAKPQAGRVQIACADASRLLTSRMQTQPGWPAVQSALATRQ